MKKWAIVVLTMLVLAGCEPKPNMADLLKNLVVSTDYDNTVDFTHYSTFYLRLDSINYYNSSDPYPSDTLWTSTTAGDFVDYTTRTVTDSLTNRGYASVSKNSSPDLKIVIFEIEDYSVSYSYYPGYGGYGYGYGGYGGYGYGGGYTTANVSDQADLYIQILDLHKLTNGQPTVIWQSDIGDIASLASDDAFIRALGQAFTQSQYLRK